MQQVALEEAEIRLGELIEMVAEGEEVIIRKDDGSAFKIMGQPELMWNNFYNNDIKSL